MILRYTAENFFSFKDEVTVDFTVGSQAGSRPGLVETDLGNKVNTVIGILGANASGKTNLLKPLGFISWFVLDSAGIKPGDRIPYSDFIFDLPADRKPTRLSLEFEFEGGWFRYELEFQRGRIRREALLRKKVRYSFLFEREWSDATKEYFFKAQDIGPTSGVPLRENSSWISSALLQEHPVAVSLRPFFESLHGNLNAHGRMPIHDAESFNVIQAAMAYEKNPQSLEQASKLLSEYDLGLAEVRVEKRKVMLPDGTEQDVSVAFGVHRIGDDRNREFLLSMMQESRGTQALFVLLRYLLPVLAQGGIAFIDEFESGLHPHMVRSIVDLFFNPASNPKNAQLIATFHSDFLLRDTLHKYQIYLVEKDGNLHSNAYRLDSMRGVRNVDNLYEKYHAGAFGGIPALP